MAKPESVVKQEIKAYIDTRQGTYGDWYVGIAEDPRERLFVDHNVDEENDPWIYSRCFGSDAARRVEEYFFALGTDGSTGGGSDNSDYVYAYKKNSHTIE